MLNRLLIFSFCVFVLNSCSSGGLHKTNSFKNKHEFQSQELNQDTSSNGSTTKMRLQEKLNAYAELAKAKIAPEHKKVMIESLQRLKNEQMEEDFPKIGDKARNFELKNVNGEEIELYDVLDEKPVVLLFYRGSWCPYCNLELKAYKDHYQEFVDAGLEVIAISPEQTEYTAGFDQKNAFPFPLLFDRKSKVADKYDLKFTLDPELVPIYKEYGIDIGERNGDDDWEIPVPATFIIAKDRTIKYVFADVDYKKRAEPESVLAVAKARL